MVKAGFPLARELWTSQGGRSWNCFIRASFAALSQRPSIRFDRSGFPGDLDHRRRLPEGAMGPPRGLPWDRDASEPSRDKLSAEAIACLACLKRSMFHFSRAWSSGADRVDVSNLRKRVLSQCRASAELWTTNRPDALLARSLTKNIRKGNRSAQPTGEAGRCSQSSVANIWAIAPAHRSRRVPEIQCQH